MKIPKNLLFSCLIALAVFAAYRPAFKAGFTNYDDDILITENPLVQEISAKNLKKILFEPYAGLYHPVVLLSYAVEYKLAGVEPGLYHLNNIILHAINSLLVFWFALLLLKDRGTALLTALLFAVHPLHVESVAWLAERKDTLYAVFYLSAMIAYIHYAENGGFKGYLLSILFFVLALLSKPMAVTLPLALFLIDYAESRKFSRASAVDKVPYLGLAAVFSVITVMWHYTSPDAAAPVKYDILAGLSGAVNALVFYAAKLFYPVNLSCFYPYSGKAWGEFFAFPLLPFIIVAAVTAAVIYMRKRGKIIVFGLCFYVVTLLPVLQLIPFGQQVPADRFAYVPSLGIFLIIAALLVSIWKNQKGPLKYLTVIFSVLILEMASYSAYQRCKVWKDSFTLWNDTISKFPSHPQAYKNRADAYKQAGQAGPAFSDYAKALEIRPAYPQVHNNRGNLYAELSLYDKAVADYTSAINENPGYVSAIYNRAIALAAQRRYDEALNDYNRVIETQPGHHEALNNRGVVRGSRGEYELAIKDLSDALLLQPDFNDAYTNRALAYFSIGDYKAAADDVNTLLKRGCKVNGSFLKALNDKLAER